MSASADFSWWNVVPTLVGGLLSSVSAIGMFALAQGVDRRKKDAEKRRKSINEAFVGLLKLMRTANAVEVLARHIDDQIKEATESGGASQEPALFVKPVVGARDKVEFLTPSEMSFLLPDNGEMITKIWEIQQRAQNNDVVLEVYNAERSAFDDFLLLNSVNLDGSDGTVVSATLEGQKGRIAELRLGKLNTTIVPLIVALDEDRVTARAITEDYLGHAIKKFGTDFPVKRVEWKELQHANP